MAIRNALVSGSVAVQFFERVLWKESDLDIFIEEGKDAKAFGKYLTEREGYNFSGTSSGVYNAIDIEEVHTYTKRSEGDSAERKAQIILTRKIPLQAILRGFYSTVVVNFFAWNKAYSMFPLHTFVHHKGYMLKPLNNHFSTLLEKYSRRGWKFQNAMWPEEISPNQPIEGTRRIGDEFSWMIPFDVSNVKWSKTPDSVLEYASFDVHLEDRDEGTEKKHYTVTAFHFFSDVLRHEYLYGVSGHWLDFLGERVDELTRLELYKMAPEARPVRPAALQGPDAPMYGCMEGHKKPDGWTY
ncbi:hypothetical protein MMC22_006941 [Lobaria immixta]|nr:hypothetical protein [Lobaria immixta]